MPSEPLKTSPDPQNIKTGPDALWYRRKLVQERKTLKRDPMPSVPPKTSLGARNIKKDPTPSVPPETSPGALNIKKGPDALGTAKNKYGRAKHANYTRRPR
jgi:hypothetical protein